MCASCGCQRPEEGHGDSRHITLTMLRCAAEAGAVSLQQVSANIAAVVDVLTTPAESVAEGDIVLKSLTAGVPKRFVLGVAYPADRPDGHKEWMSTGELEKAAWEYVRKHRRIGFYHVDGTLGHADVVESFIWPAPDWETTDINGDPQIVRKGDWLIGAILDEPAFDLVRKGKADGWSVDGLARRRRKAPPTR